MPLTTRSALARISEEALRTWPAGSAAYGAGDPCPSQGHGACQRVHHQEIHRVYGRLTRRTHTTIRESHLQQYDANGARAESWVSSGLASCMVPAERCCTLHDAASLRLADRYPGQGIDGTYVAMAGAM